MPHAQFYSFHKLYDIEKGVRSSEGISKTKKKKGFK